MTDESHSSARILDVRPIRVREELDRGRIVVLAGAGKEQRLAQTA